MNIGEFINSINRFDLLVVLFLGGMFVLGFVQGTIRRVLGIASMVFSFLLAANLRDPLGNYLAGNWNQFPDEYAVMLGFGMVFVAAVVAFTLVIQGFYHHQPLFEKANFVDEVLGGILGIIQGLFLLAFIVIILDSFFSITDDPRERRGTAVPAWVPRIPGRLDDGRDLPITLHSRLLQRLRPAHPR